MERNNIIYKARRQMQIMAHYIFSDETMSKFYFKVVTKQKLDLKNPKTFNEKLQWLKLYYYPQNPLVVQCADKYAVRSYITEKGFGNKLVPLLGVWDNAKKIEWDKLPDKFVLKCTHGCAYNIVVSDKSKLNIGKTVNQLNKWQKEDFGAFNIEPHYSKIKSRMITCEEYLGECISDYKFFCFHGVPKFIYVSSDMIHDRQAKIGFFNLDGSKIDLKRDDYADIAAITLPPFFDEMKKAAVELCSEFPFVRVDFFSVNDRYYFAELTFTPSACMMPFNPENYNLEWGNLLTLPNKD